MLNFLVLTRVAHSLKALIGRRAPQPTWPPQGLLRAHGMHVRISSARRARGGLPGRRLWTSGNSVMITGAAGGVAGSFQQVQVVVKRSLCLQCACKPCVGSSQARVRNPCNTIQETLRVHCSGQFIFRRSDSCSVCDRVEPRGAGCLNLESWPAFANCDVFVACQGLSKFDDSKF